MARPLRSPTRQQLAQMRQNLAEHFDLEELRTLCADLGVDYDSLRGEGKIAKARELVEYLDRTGRISELIAICVRQRPNVTWEYTPVLPVPRAGRKRVGRYMAVVGVLVLSAAILAFIANGMGWFTPCMSPPPIPMPTTCATLTTPVRVGVVRLAQCPANVQQQLVQNWTTSDAQAILLDQALDRGGLEQVSSEFHIAVSGSCGGQQNQFVSLAYVLTTTRKPDEIYQPVYLGVTATLTDSIDLGKALIAYQRGDYGFAAEQFARLPQTRTSPEVTLLWANSLLLAGLDDNAVDAFERTVLALKPQWSAAYNNLGVARLDKEWRIDGKLPSESPELDQAIKWAKPDETRVKLLAYFNRSYWRLWAGQSQEAWEDCEAASGLDNRSALPYVCRVLYYNHAQPDAQPYLIQETLDDAQRANDIPAQFYYLRADWYRRNKQWQAGLDDGQHFLALMQDRACLKIDRWRIRDAGPVLANLTCMHAQQP